MIKHTNKNGHTTHTRGWLLANTVLFQLYDVDGDGLVSVGDVETLLKSAAGESLTEEEVHKLAVSGLDNQDAVDFQGFALVCSPCTWHPDNGCAPHQRHLRSPSLLFLVCVRVQLFPSESAIMRKLSFSFQKQM